MFSNCIFKRKIKCIAFLQIIRNICGTVSVLAKLQQKNPSKNVDFLQKSEVTLFTPKDSSILNEKIKVTVQIWNAIPC